MFGKSILVLGATLMTLTIVPPPAHGADAHEPTGASLAWTSNDPVVVEARHLIHQGKFSDAEKLLKKDLSSATGEAKEAREQTIEIMRRIRCDYSLTVDDLRKKARVSDAQLEQWRKQGGVQARLIDGKEAYFRFEPSNMNRFCAPYKELRQSNLAPNDSQSEGWTLVKHLKHVADEAEQTGEQYVLPVRMHVNYSITVPADAEGMKPGALVRVWLPYPQEYGKRQFDINLISTSPSNPKIAPTSKGDHPMTGTAQRSLYLEAKVPDPVKAMKFEEVLEFTSQAYYPILDEAKAQPLPKNYDQGNLGERLPHIAFTPELKKTVAEIVRGETNPLAQARRIFHWISTNIAYHAEEEYCTIPSISQACLTRHRGDCGVQSLLFITMCRAVGIPARWQSGWETKPTDWTFHDWAEFYVAPWGWLPADASYGVQKSTDPRIRDFYCGHIDSYRFIVNRNYGCELTPPKPSLRSEPLDFQRGEVEIDGKNLYFDLWQYNMQFTWGSQP